MNERIRELVWQAANGMLSYDAEGDFRLSEKEVEKFGELLLENCIDEMITQMWIHGIDQSNNPSFYKAVEKTKRQFGNCHGNETTFRS